MVTVYVRNLPGGATEDDIKEALEYHAKIETIEFVPDPREDTDRKQARIQLDMPRFDAEELAVRFDGRIVRGEPIRVIVPLHE